MIYEEDVLLKAYQLHQQLMTKGEIQKKKDADLYRLYSDPDIREVLQRVFLPIDQAIIVKVEETLFFVPEVQNDAFSYTNEELREKGKFRDNKELYLAQFIWMLVISEFYGDQFLLTGETRSFVKVDDILNKAKEWMGKFDQIPEEEQLELAYRYELNIPYLLNEWHNLSEVTDKVKELRKARTMDYGFLLKALGFLEKEKMLVVKEEQEIVMTEKMKHIIDHYYHQESRINEIKSLLNEVNERVLDYAESQ
ncbi:DUF6063 family protein [Neobacillus niacini]|uniref:DUF6063 family protein n=1 Tax=Neobacillus niacini TaxID=86668 RepID=UPI0007AC0F12|nr:DUF6063 family protein [Neobacillus niacini]MEC1523350.1 DUF6063 family protein [Neobacillus niacini]